MATRHPLPFSSADTTANTSVFVNVSREYRINDLILILILILWKIYTKMVKDTLEERIFSAKVVYLRERADTLFDQLVNHQLQIRAAHHPF